MSMKTAGRALAWIALVVAAAAAAIVLAAGPGTRFGWWGFRTGLRMLGYGAYAAVGGAALGLLGVLLGSARRLALAALVVAVAAFAVPWTMRRNAQMVPPIHDISTDTGDPPKFAAVLARRGADSNSAEWAGDAVAVQQRIAYPDVKPLHLIVPPPQAFDRALATARSMGWEIVDASPDQGRIEATATTTWFGFKDDVVVRVRPDPNGSTVDVRSLSRVGRSDLGANANRIRRYLARLRNQS